MLAGLAHHTSRVFLKVYGLSSRVQVNFFLEFNRLLNLLLYHNLLVNGIFENRQMPIDVAMCIYVYLVCSCIIFTMLMYAYLPCACMTSHAYKGPAKIP